MTMVTVSEDNKDQRLLKLAKREFDSQERNNALAQWEDQSEFLLPGQSGTFTTEAAHATKGDKKTRRLYHSAPIQYNYELASAIHSIVTNPAHQWSKQAFKDEDLNNDAESVGWLDDTTSRMHSAWNDSNFDVQVAKAYQSYTALGTMVLFHEEDERTVPGEFGGHRFTSIHLSQIAFAENYRGEVDKAYRKFTYTGEQALERWPDSLPKELAEKAEQKPDEEMVFWHIIRPRKASEVRLNDIGLASPEQRPFESVFLTDKGGDVVERGGYYEFPMYIVRFGTGPGEVYGRGPGHIAIPEVRSLNTLRELGLTGLARAVLPPWIANRRDVLGSLDLRPDRVTVVGDINGIKPLTSGTRTDIAAFSEERMLETIKQAFFIDKLMLPPRTETGEMTAFEVDTRLAQMQRVLGPTLSRLNTEFLDKLSIRSFNMMLRAGALAELPDTLKERGVRVDIKFINSLARSQQSDELNNIRAWAMSAAELSQIKPEAADFINVDGIVKLEAKIRGIPEVAVTNSDEVAQVREQRAQAQAAAQQMEAATQMSDIASKVPAE